MNEDKSKVYKQFLQEALSNKKVAVESKNWCLVAKIEVKIADFEAKTKEIEESN
ncbi:hypothetical protein [Clostridium sp.]|uniref:hypothetical protein n=1 Tax=Clostridium sp. TaxID=1506 RepID=UPI0026330E3A|nr:hypothetical protein [Clostridium sp.]